MSRGWTISLFVIAFFLLFALFQLDSETRQRTRRLGVRLDELDLKIATYIRGAEAKDPRQEISQVQFSHQALMEDFKKNRKTIVELLELLIVKNEEQSIEIERLKNQLPSTKQVESAEVGAQ